MQNQPKDRPGELRRKDAYPSAAVTAQAGVSIADEGVLHTCTTDAAGNVINTSSQTLASYAQETVRAANRDAALGHELAAPFLAAIDQAMYGKGERHGGARTPFLEQPWNHYAKLHGRGFLTGQAAKKIEEAASTRHGEEFIREAYGALVYIGMAILHEQEQMRREKVLASGQRRHGSDT